LLALALKQRSPSLRAWCFSPPGCMVNSPLLAYTRSFVTSVVAGKDCVPRSGTLALNRLVDEMVVSLARCRAPKLKVLLGRWWRRASRPSASELFYDYEHLPEESREFVRRYLVAEEIKDRQVVFDSIRFDFFFFFFFFSCSGGRSTLRRENSRKKKAQLSLSLPLALPPLPPSLLPPLFQFLSSPKPIKTGTSSPCSPQGASFSCARSSPLIRGRGRGRSSRSSPSTPCGSRRRSSPARAFLSLRRCSPTT
jgi:hypothetical protein